MMSGVNYTRSIFWILIIVSALFVGGVYLSGVQTDLIEMLHEIRSKPWVLLTTASIYALCLAIPFVPGIEIGLLLMIIFGHAGILMAYVGTIVGLSLAFMLGMFLRNHLKDYPVLEAWRNRAKKTQQDANNRISQSRLGAWLQPRFARHQSIYPYLITAALFNLPGNWLIGGGGGISLAGGLSGQLRCLPFVLTVILAASILPLLAWFGLIELERWLPMPAD